MTAHSETFCDEQVRDAAEEAFGNLIPEYDTIRIPKEWMGIWSDEGYPEEGTITYEDDDRKVVAKVHFVTKYELVELNGLCIEASPTQLVLELPDGRKYCDKYWLIKELKEQQEALRKLRDKQEAVPCLDENECLCNYFDRAIDDIEETMKKIGNPKDLIEQTMEVE